MFLARETFVLLPSLTYKTSTTLNIDSTSYSTAVDFQVCKLIKAMMIGVSVCATMQDR